MRAIPELDAPSRAPAPTITQFRRNESGAIAMMFAVMFFGLVGAIGIAVDFMMLRDLDGELQSAADSAALSATSSTMAAVAEAGMDAERDVNDAIDRAKKFFISNSSARRAAAAPPVVDAKFDDGKLSVTVSYQGKMQTRFAQLFGFSEFSYAGNATAVAKLPPFVDVHILVDTSGSMAIGVSQAEQDRLRAETGCAFACHDGVPVNGYADAYAYAIGSGITLRYGAVNDGIRNLLDLIDSEDNSHQFIRAAIYSIDDAMQTASPLTADTDDLRAALPSAPVTSSETAGATKFKENINALIASIGPGGDGSAPNRAIKLLIIATDGAQDPGRSWTHDVALRSEVDAFDMSFCEPAKANGLNVGIIHTPYVKMDWDWGYQETLGRPSQRGGPGTRADDIEPALQQCAGGRYVKAGDAAAIETAFTSIFRTLSAVHLTH